MLQKEHVFLVSPEVSNQKGQKNNLKNRNMKLVTQNNGHRCGGGLIIVKIEATKK